MINQKVVFVLGAGASKPYGFPLGCELRDRAIASSPAALAKHIAPDIDDLEREQYQLRLRNFIENLRESSCTSVDAFLEERDAFKEIGKAVMAYYLMLCENPDSLYRCPPEEHWYGYLVNLMLLEGFEGFPRNSLGIITYNYDRSLEYFLFKALKARYPDRDCAKAVKSIPIVHLYGQLGKLPELESDPTGRHYNTKTDIGHQRLARKGIRIVSDSIDEIREFSQAHKMVAEADYVIFLGFGYLPTNVERLRLVGGKTRYIGTAVDITIAERNLRTKLFPARSSLRAIPRIYWDESPSVLRFLRDNVDFLKGGLQDLPAAIASA